MTTGVELQNLTVSFELELKESPFEANFEDRFAKACETFKGFLDDSGANDFSHQYEGIQHFSFNVTLCDDERMRELNSEYRNKNKTTDVLTLALYEDIRAGDEMLFQEVELGDIFISAPVMNKQAEEFKVTIEQEFFHLLVHGFLHLLGFDHEISEAEEKLMEGHEKKLVDEIYQNLYENKQ